ncbi:patatin-like phospholipase family protein [Modicisalibacter sp. 'Wilcox']|uniref:patatin-like phospholipase family protein n=1 Tax=Modicisalibacter sp. 'Wilcox' TaxID=2679914 RepID=UPI0013D14D57|nr:patatin-like phospholipase family protein [Modicisalibacter sp. 'Wilcox']
MARPMNILVLQGGGALGAYQAGVYQALSEADIEPDWVVGTSIGAINAALIAGNHRRDVLARLEDFWTRVAQPSSSRGAALEHYETELAKFLALTTGVPGFFHPRPLWELPLTHNWWGTPPSFYDVAPLERTLETLVDFERLGTRNLQDGKRLSVGAVNISRGTMRYFDSHDEPLSARHVMASGALPPAFPPVWVDGEAYWDGGLCSNTPIDYVLESERPGTDMAVNCYVIDLWSPRGPVPETISDAMHREKDIQYATRAGHNLHFLKEINRLREALRKLGKHLPDAARDDDEVAALLGLARQSPVNIVRLLAPAREAETAQKDIDFSYSTIMERWRAGYHDMKGALAICPCQRDPVSDEIGANVCSYRSNLDGHLEDLTDVPFE